MRLLPFEYAVRNLGRSPMRTFASIFGSGLVVLLVLAAGGFIRGMERSLTVSGGEHNVMLLGAGSEESVERSQIDMSVPTLVNGSVAGIKQRFGVPYISPEVHMALVVRTARDAPTEQQAVMRGVTPAAFLVHPQVRITAGRAPRPGEYELMAGQLAATRLGLPEENLAIGQTIWFDNHDWTITGRFTAPQTVMNAELWVPLTDLQIATRRDTLSCVVLTLGDATFEDVDIWAAQRLDLELVALRENDYYASLLAFYRPVRAMIWVTAGLIALGGLLGGLNTMYAAFAARVRELGALQTLGFPRRALVVSFLQESLLAAAGGGLIAATIGLLLLDGLATRFSMGAFALTLDAPVLLLGLLAGLGLGVLGIIPPLYRCLRLPIVEALRMT
jgi:putative ABC transport system permease protein